MVELRKRKAPAEPVPPPPSKKKSNPVKTAIAKAKAAVTKKAAPATNGASTAVGKTGKVAVGDTITLESFGGEVETNDGEKTSLKALVDGSEGGVVLFTYPKASTPGCTTQACLFRDSYTPLTSTGFAIYGLSTDSPKSNTTFKTNQKLPYPLLCDPSATLIGAIGMKKAPKGTTRGVFVVDKAGKVLAAEAGGPAATVEVVKKLVEGGKTKEEDVEEKKEEAEAAPAPATETEAAPPAPATLAAPAVVEEKAATPAADVADQVADTAAKLDEGVKV